jgi:hypothetical protein
MAMIIAPSTNPELAASFLASGPSCTGCSSTQCKLTSKGGWGLPEVSIASLLALTDVPFVPRLLKTVPLSLSNHDRINGRSNNSLQKKSTTRMRTHAGIVSINSQAA